MISLAITTYNRCELLLESFKRVLDNDFVSEIIIVDDCSNLRLFKCMEGLLPNNHKIKLFRNETNLKPFLNKIEAVKKCTNDWVILFDSDNIIDNDFIEVVKNLKKEEDTIYLPEMTYDTHKNIVSDFRGFGELTKSNAKTDQKTMLFMGISNYLINKNKYLEVVKNKDVNCYASDTIYASYLWLLAGYKIKTLPASYIHRVHDGSYWNNNIDISTEFMNMIIEEMLKW